MKTGQRGNTIIGLIIGIVLGLGAALGIAVYVTKVPIPFMTNKAQRNAEQDEAEARRNRDWDPNAPLAGKAGAAKPPTAGGTVSSPDTTTPPADTPSTGGPVPVTVPDATASKPPVPVTVAKPNTGPASNDPLGDLVRAKTGGGDTSNADDPFLYFVQAGAFRTNDDAEAQRAKLSLMGVEAKVSEREQSGRTVFRVRAGPFNKKEEADRLKARLDGGGLEAALVRVQK